jgi:hypothetical protein
MVIHSNLFSCSCQTSRTILSPLLLQPHHQIQLAQLVFLVVAPIPQLLCLAAEDSQLSSVVTFIPVPSPGQGRTFLIIHTAWHFFPPEPASVTPFRFCLNKPPAPKYLSWTLLLGNMTEDTSPNASAKSMCLFGPVLLLGERALDWRIFIFLFHSIINFKF